MHLTGCCCWKNYSWSWTQRLFGYNVNLDMLSKDLQKAPNDVGPQNSKGHCVYFHFSPALSGIEILAIVKVSAEIIRSEPLCIIVRVILWHYAPTLGKHATRTPSHIALPFSWLQTEGRTAFDLCGKTSELSQVHCKGRAHHCKSLQAWANIEWRVPGKICCLGWMHMANLPWSEMAGSQHVLGQENGPFFKNLGWHKGSSFVHIDSAMKDNGSTPKNWHKALGQLRTWPALQI